MNTGVPTPLALWVAFGRCSSVSMTIFEMELEGWCLDDEKWPSIRTLGVFLEWFTVEFHSMVIDLSGDPLVDDYA